MPEAISEVCRVLKPGGVFYCTTNGTEGMSKYLHNALKDFNPLINAFDEGRFPFTLQNGGEILKERFSSVEMIEYIDSLRLTETRDLVDWIESTITITNIAGEELAGLYDYFEGIREADGAIVIPKQVGIFVSIK